MFDYKTITPNTFLTARFEKTPTGDIKVVDKESGTEVGIICIVDNVPTSLEPEALNCYNLWAGRPERRVGQLVNWEGRSLDQLMTMYEELLVGAYLLRFPETEINPEDSMYAKMIDWLRSTDFYRAPASTQYHESIVGGLLIHSLKVYNEAILLNRLPKFRKVPIASVALAALCHDWCKINTYVSYTRNVKNEETGQWEKVDAFKREYSGLTFGHGVTSMFYAMRYMPDLTEEEAAAIRWHQGRWNVCDAELNEFQRCNEIYPLVHLVQFADQLAIVQY